MIKPAIAFHRLTVLSAFIPMIPKMTERIHNIKESPKSPKTNKDIAMPGSFASEPMIAERPKTRLPEIQPIRAVIKEIFALFSSFSNRGDEEKGPVSTAGAVV